MSSPVSGPDNPHGEDSTLLADDPQTQNPPAPLPVKTTTSGPDNPHGEAAAKSAAAAKGAANGSGE